MPAVRRADHGLDRSLDDISAPTAAIGRLHDPDSQYPPDMPSLAHVEDKEVFAKVAVVTARVMDIADTERADTISQIVPGRIDSD